MTQRISEKVKELAILNVLKYLEFESGANASDVDRFANVRHLRNPSVLLGEMTQAGLIRRQEVPERRDGKSKPYYLTDAGKRYLAEAGQRAQSPEIGQRQDWSASEIAPDMRQKVADFLATLPEFHDSDATRIREVSQQLAQTLSPSPAKPR